MFKENGSYQFDDKVLTDYLSTIWSMATEHLSDSVIVRFLLNNASRLGLHEDVHIELNRQERDNLLELSLFVLYRHLLDVSSDLRKLPLGVHPYTFTRFQQLHFEQSTYRDKQALPPDDRAMALGSDGVRRWRSYTFAREYSPEKLLRLAVKERKQEKDDSIQILDIGGHIGLALDDFPSTLDEIPVEKWILSNDFYPPYPGLKKLSLDIHAIPQHMTKEFDVVLSNFSWRYFMYPDIAFFNVLSLLKQNGIAALDVENLCSIGPYRIVLELLISQNIKEVDDAPVRQREWFARVTQIEDLLIGFSNLGMLEWLHPYRKINLMFRKDEDAPPYAGGLFFRLLAPQDEVQSFINDSRKKFLDEWKSSLTAIKHADNIRQEYRENPRYALLREAVGTMFGFD